MKRDEQQENGTNERRKNGRGKQRKSSSDMQRGVRHEEAHLKIRR
ncbi:MAG: hypothetical protein WB988_01980 [Candidatus Nitrosopolaris sp.]